MCIAVTEQQLLENTYLSFINDFTRNFIILGFNSSLSSHKGDVLLTLKEALVPQEKMILILVKQNQNFFLSLYFNSGNSYLFVGRKEIYQFKTSNKNVNFHLNFVQEAYFDSGEASLTGNIYRFSIDYNAIDKSSILNIHKYLTGQNYIK